MLAADSPASAITPLALTPGQDGRMRADPVPLSARSDRQSFGYGYGGGPITTYAALLRVALGDAVNTQPILERLAQHRTSGHTISQLWHTISTTSGPPRLSWPQLQTLGARRP